MYGSLWLVCLASLFAELNSAPLLAGFTAPSPWTHNPAQPRAASVRPLTEFFGHPAASGAARSRMLGPPLFRGRPRSLALRMQEEAIKGWGPEEPDLAIKVNLVMLRSPIVPWYNGADMCDSDVAEILSGFEQFVRGGEGKGWRLEAVNETGVYGIVPGPEPCMDLSFALLGLEAWKQTQLIRDVTSPWEPYIQFMLTQFTMPEEDDTGMARRLSAEFTDWAMQYSGMKWTSEDVPASGLGGVVIGDDPTLDQATVIPPTSAATIQKAIAEEDRPFFDTTALTDWLIPQLAIDPRDDDSETLGVAGTTPFDGREIDESFDLGMAATEGSVPKKVRDAYERDIALEPEAESDGVEEEASEDGEREYSKDE